MGEVEVGFADCVIAVVGSFFFLSFFLGLSLGARSWVGREGGRDPVSLVEVCAIG